ncbi:MAG: hypothetical protein QM790_08805 [Nibricoccus sp.]
MSTKNPNSLWLGVGLAFGLLVAAWVTFIVIAAKHPVEQVPLQNTTKEAH